MDKNLKNSSDGLVDIPTFKIARDKCEKEPLDDLFSDSIQIVLEDLRPTGGDYSAVGCENYVAIERKSIQDLLGTLWGKSQLSDGTWQTNLCRFAYELSKLSTMHLSYVAIEGTRDDLSKRIEWRAKECRKYGHIQKITYDKTIGLISSLQSEFGVCFCFFRDRIEMAAAIYSDLYHAWRRFNGLSKSKLGNYIPSGVNKAVQSSTYAANNAPSTTTFDAEKQKMV